MDLLPGRDGRRSTSVHSRVIHGPKVSISFQTPLWGVGLVEMFPKDDKKTALYEILPQLLLKTEVHESGRKWIRVQKIYGSFVLWQENNLVH